MMTYNTFIPFLGINIQTEQQLDSKIPGTIQLKINSPNISELIIRLDERYNTLHTPKKILSKEEVFVINQLKLKFNELKSTDISYGNINSDYEIEYEPTKNIMLKDFIRFLKIENRESILENILQK